MSKYLSVIEQNSSVNSGNIEESVHNIRKTIKKIRAVFKLIRDEIGYSTYLRENDFYRDIGRQLSECRNLDVYLSVAMHLDQKFTLELNYSCFRHLILQIRNQKATYINQLLRPEGFFSEITQKMVIAKSGIEKIKIRENSFDALLNGLRNSYKKSRKALDGCLNDPIKQNAHRLRKTLKNIWYQVRILNPVYPPVFDAYEKSLKSTTEILGEVNDFAEFKTWLNNSSARGLNRSNRAIINTMLDDLQNERLSAALPEIQMALIETTSQFIKRIGGYWNVILNNHRNIMFAEAEKVKTLNKLNV
ncbi:MAG: CHAD domain-containing protein [Bacteroidales bacterium]|nr:CHAD domain-containing protein [Bacteroidales bacterium]